MFNRIKIYNFKENQQLFASAANKIRTHKKNKTDLFSANKTKEIYLIFNNNVDDNKLKRNYFNSDLNVDYEALIVLERKKKKRLLVKREY